jgi:hypothetical protein
MEAMFMDTPVYRRLYNCSFYEVSSVPLEKRQHVVLGVALAVISLIEEVSM